MKFNYYYCKVLVCLGLIAIAFTGCQKVYDYVNSHPQAELKTCPILQFTYPVAYSDYSDVLTITYNSAGDPVQATRPTPGTGAPNYLFKYVNGRLSEFIGVYSNGTTTEQWHRYQYGPEGRIILDSVFIFAEMVNGSPTDPYDKYVIEFTYDSKGRVILATYITPDGPFYSNSSAYNSDGNKIGSEYGQHVSFRRSNKIWMFLDQDYSVNDRVGSSGFNSLLMPTVLDFGEELQDSFLGNYFSSAGIVYGCQ